MHPDDERFYLVLDRYLAGEASPSDADAVRQWLAADPQRAVLLDDLRLIKRVAAEAPPDADVDAAWRKMAAVLDAPRRRGLRRPLLVSLAAAAAIIAVVWGTGGAGLLHRSPEWKENVTAAASRVSVRLRDGTHVTLAPKSRLRYTTDFGSTQRDVYLDGEAYFQVQPDAQRPFRVHTAGSVTEDLGTAFVIEAYADQATTEVVVAEGRVALRRVDTTARSAPPALVLGARDLGRLDSGGVATLQRGIDVQRHLAWTRGVLAFDAEPLGDAVLTLERWYNVEIRLEPGARALAGRRLTATFSNEPVDLVLARIALTLRLRVDREGLVWLLRTGS